MTEYVLCRSKYYWYLLRVKQYIFAMPIRQDSGTFKSVLRKFSTSTPEVSATLTYVAGDNRNGGWGLQKRRGGKGRNACYIPTDFLVIKLSQLSICSLIKKLA